MSIPPFLKPPKESGSVATKHNKSYLRNKFWKALPQIREDFPHVASLFDEAQKCTSGDRKKQEYKVIQEAFTNVDGTCHWVLDLSKPFFKEAKTRYTCYSNMEAYAFWDQVYMFSFLFMHKGLLSLGQVFCLCIKAKSSGCVFQLQGRHINKF